MVTEETVLTHEPVMLDEALRLLQPRSGGLYCDGTAGRGGHTRAILETSSPEGRVIAIDRDPEAVRAVRAGLEEFGERLEVVHGRFSELPQVLEERGINGLDGLLVDLGVSSPQLDDGARGFSFQREGPVDMRLDPTEGETALDLISTTTEAELARILKEYGEERRARSVARALKRALREEGLTTTTELASVVRRTLHQRRTGRIDAATRTFQALRIAVNDELGELETMLDVLPEILNDGGRAVFIAFHSLEDRAVKRGLRHWAGCRCAPRSPRCTCGGAKLELLNRKPLISSEEESRRNPRARSAKLRGARRVSDQAREEASWVS